jgi:hypothetical protein
MESSISNVAELALKIRHHNADRKGSLIGIDGALSTGKSTVARQLAAELNARLLEGDLYLLTSKDTYVESLALDCLGKVLQRALENNRPVIFESVLLRQVLAKLELKPSIIIYVRHCSRVGSPRNPKFFQPQSHEHKISQEVNDENLTSGDSDPLQRLPREVCSYHMLERPQEHSDIIFDNVFDIPTQRLR